jgi:hypothetical protein
MNGAMRCTSFDGDGTSGLVRGRRARLGRVGFTDVAARQVGAWWFVATVLHGGDGGAMASGELWWEYSCIPAPSSNILLLGSPRLTNSINMLTNSHG